jgi:hypothetical protein
MAGGLNSPPRFIGVVVRVACATVTGAILRVIHLRITLGNFVKAILKFARVKLTDRARREAGA